MIVSFTNFFLLYLFIPGKLPSGHVSIIKSGLSNHQISGQLYKEGIIDSPFLFLIGAKLYTFCKPLKSGQYLFTPNISILQILRILASGKSLIHKLVFPEGAQVKEVIDKINSEEILLGEIKGQIPEGFLLPSTYFYSYGDQKEQIIAQMRSKMTRALDEVMLKIKPDSVLQTRQEVLILASIVEKEATLDYERPLIAAVFLNRLKKGMKLQADPTTIYAITEGRYKLGRPLLKKDLILASPYNTYYANGLPPGPIACPGKKSLEAVVAPAKTDALFFVVNGQGGHNFSSTLKEHNINVQNYRNNNKNK